MTKQLRLTLLAVVFMIEGFFSGISAKAEEYTNPERQAKWEKTQAEHAEKAERRRAHFKDWENRLGKLKPHRHPALKEGSDVK